MTDKRKTLNDVSPKEWDEVLEQYMADQQWLSIPKSKTSPVASQAMAETLANPDDDPGFPVMNGIGELTYNHASLGADEWSTFFNDCPVSSDFDPRAEVPYKFNEGPLIAEFKAYIDSTYDGHYSKNKFQSTEFIIDCDHGLGFTLGNVLKYTQRYGKKEGHNRKDLLKILHYALIALSIHDDNFEK
jgi:hypothetical protein